MVLDRVMSASSIETLMPPPPEAPEPAVEVKKGALPPRAEEATPPSVAVLTSMTGPSAMHPVYGRWELSFLSLKSLPLPFYYPFENCITLSRDGPMSIVAKARFVGIEVRACVLRACMHGTCDVELALTHRAPRPRP
jgi:hypothetical protein